MRVLLFVGCSLVVTACSLPQNVRYKCDEGACALAGQKCAADGYCYPAEQVLDDGGVIPPSDGGACVPADLDALCAAAECGFVRDGCGAERDCQKSCGAPAECGVREPNRCANPSLCTPEGWCWENPLPQGLTLQAGWRFDARHTWWVGENHLVLFFDGERSWLQENPGALGDTLYDVHGGGPDHVFAVGDNGLILHFDGRAWERESTPTPLTTSLRTVFSFGDGGAIAAGFQGRVVTRSAAASPFSRWAAEAFPATGEIRSVFTDSAGTTLYAVQRNNELYARPIDASTLWTRIDTVPLQETFVGAARGEGLVFGGSSGVGQTLVQRDPDGGWRPLISSGGYSVLNLERGDGGFFALGFSTEHGWLDDADGWTRIQSQGGSWNAAVALEGPRVQLGGSWGSMATLELDGGFAWVSTPRPTAGQFLNAICGTSPYAMYAVGGTDSQTACSTCNAKWLEREVTSVGPRWNVKEFQLGSTTRLSGCYAESPTRVWFPGNDSKFVFLNAGTPEYGDFGGALAGQYRSGWGTPAAGYYFVRENQELTYSASGTDLFQLEGHQAPAPLRAVWGLDENDIVAVGRAGVVSAWDGNSWVDAQLNGGNFDFEAIHGVRLATGERRYVAAGGFGTLLSVTGDAGVFTQLPAGGSLRSTWVAPSGTAWVVGRLDAGSLVVRQDLGGPWTSEPLPLNRSLNGVFGISDTGGTSVWVSGSAGAILRKDVR